MIVVEWEAFLASPNERPLAATVGVFDGLHAGHRHLIGKVRASDPAYRTAAVTFKDNPKRLLYPATYHGDLASLAQKLEGFEALGLDLVVLIDFSGNFSKLAGRDFLSLLKDRGRLSYLAVGSNFRCGHRLDTDARAVAAFLSAQGVQADIVEPVEWNGHPVSSSRIRHAVMDGRLEDAAAMLGRPYELDLRALTALDVDDDVFVFPFPSGRVVPPEGLYVGRVRTEGGMHETILRLEEGRISFETAKGVLPEAVSLLRLTKETKR